MLVMGMCNHVETKANWAELASSKYDINIPCNKWLVRNTAVYVEIAFMLYDIWQYYIVTDWRSYNLFKLKINYYIKMEARDIITMMIADLQLRFNDNTLHFSLGVSPEMKDITRNYVYAQNTINAYRRHKLIIF